MNIANVLSDSDPRTPWPILLYLQSPWYHYQTLARAMLAKQLEVGVLVVGF